MVILSYVSAVVGVMSLGLMLASWDCASRDVAGSDAWCFFDLFAAGPPYICTPVPKCTEEPNIELDSACCGLGGKCAASVGPWAKPEKAKDLRMVDNFYCTTDINQCEVARLDIISNTESWPDEICGGESAKWNGERWMSKYVPPAEPEAPPPPPPPTEPEYMCEKVPACKKQPSIASGNSCKMTKVNGDTIRCGKYGSCEENILGQNLYISCQSTMAKCEARRETELARSRINATKVNLSPENRECLDADPNNALWLPKAVQAFQGNENYPAKDYAYGWRN